jgi:hypothetical protein
MRVRQCRAAKENQIRMPFTDHLIGDARHAQIPADTDRYANFPPYPGGAFNHEGFFVEGRVFHGVRIET